MDNLKEKYDNILAKRETLKKQINELEKNELIKKYFELCNQNEQLRRQEEDMYGQVKLQEYSSCNHIWVKTLHDYDSYECRSYDYYGCIKCGLDQRVFNLLEQGYNLKSLTLEQKIMYDYMYGTSSYRGMNTGKMCDLDLARAIYSKIKEAHPNIDDETALKYFKSALYNIRETKVSDERKSNRAKRLLLNETAEKVYKDYCK